jgi:hypothetical protein
MQSRHARTANTGIGVWAMTAECAAERPTIITPEKCFYKDVFAWIPELLFPVFH